jgi:hypothetical protein
MAAPGAASGVSPMKVSGDSGSSPPPFNQKSHSGDNLPFVAPPFKRGSSAGSGGGSGISDALVLPPDASSLPALSLPPLQAPPTSLPSMLPPSHLHSGHTARLPTSLPTSLVPSEISVAGSPPTAFPPITLPPLNALPPSFAPPPPPPAAAAEQARLSPPKMRPGRIPSRETSSAAEGPLVPILTPAEFLEVVKEGRQTWVELDAGEYLLSRSHYLTFHPSFARIPAVSPLWLF